MRNTCDYGIIMIVLMLPYPIQEFLIQWGNSNIWMLYCPSNLTLVCRGCYWNQELTYLCWFFHWPHIGFLISHKIHTKYYKNNWYWQLARKYHLHIYTAVSFIHPVLICTSGRLDLRCMLLSQDLKIHTVVFTVDCIRQEWEQLAPSRHH